MAKLNVQSECTTVVKWEVSNFSTVATRDDPKKELNSYDFQLDSSAIKCYLSFDPTNRHKDGDKNYSSLYLHVKDFADQSFIKLRYRLWIENQLGEKAAEHLSELDIVFKKPCPQNWGYHKFVHHDEIYDNQFVKNDVIFLCARIFRGDALPKQPTEFHRNLWNSYKKGLTGECVLVVSGEKLKVSKTLLAAHSEVFKKMLMSGVEEEAINEIKIYDFDAKTIKALIEYLHKQSVDNLNEVAFELFKAADKYDIEGLKEQCEESLIQSIDKDNLRDRIILAFTYKSEVLKWGVLDFIETSNNGLLASIMGSSEWIDFTGQNKELASEIIADLFEKLEIQY